MLVPVIYVIALILALVNAYFTPRVRYFDKFTWVMFILFLPFIGIAGWFLFGADRRPEGDELGDNEFDDLDELDETDEPDDPDPLKPE